MLLPVLAAVNEAMVRVSSTFSRRRTKLDELGICSRAERDAGRGETGRGGGVMVNAGCDWDHNTYSTIVGR